MSYAMVKKKGDRMNSNKIKAMLVERGISQAEIARCLGLRRGTVNRVLNGRGKSKRVRDCVINRLGTESIEYWPEVA
jgi:transcriptional regulator with XRE-family HTH domain